MTAVPFTPAGFDPALFGIICCTLAVLALACALLDHFRPGPPTNPR